jgi:Tol biopolymer transport system component
MIGRTIAHYQVTDRLGAGGMGEVYRARDSKLGRDVALKVLPEVFARDPDRLMRFEREARLLASLNHANLAVIHGIEQDADRRVLVLELIEGDDLSKRIGRGALPLDEALAIARQVADAVEAAHEQGVVHRDLKPANIVVNADGVVKVLDFGLAKALESDASPTSGLSQSPTLLASSPTAAGVILGTAAYMSPEQARGRKVDRRADIFAFGCVLYEMLTGRQAFPGDTVSDTLAAILRAQPDWSALPANTPRAIVQLLRRCLEKDPKQRLRDIGEARIAIDAVQRGVADEPAAAGAPAEAGSKRAWLPWAVAAIAFAAAAVAAFVPRTPRVEPSPLMDLAVTLPENASLALRGQHPAPPAISPDGRRVAFGITQQGSTILCVRRLDSPTATVIPGTDGAGYPFWSPDGKQVAFFAQGKLKRVDANGGPVTTICDAPLGKGGSWGADGTIVFAPNYASGIMRVAADGGEPVPATVPDSTRGEVSHRFPRLLPDGTRFLYVTRSVSARSGGQGVAGIKLRMGSVDGSFDREIMATESNALYADGHLLFTRNGFLVAQPFDPETQVLSGEAAPLADKVRAIAGASYSIFDASTNGLLLFQSGSTVEGSQLTWVGLDGKEIGRLGEPAQIDDPIRISPDGRYVTAAIFDPRIGTPDVWIWDIERGLRTRFTTDTAADNNPLWSPDGNRIVFSSPRRGHVELFVKNVGGSAEETLLHSGKGDNFGLAWSPDGSDVLSAQLVTGGGWTCIAIPVDRAGEPEEVLTVMTGFGASFSPGGRWLVYDSADAGNRDAFVISFRGAGRKWQVSTAGGFSPRWVGSHIYYFNERSMLRTAVTEEDSTVSIGSEEVLFPVSELVDFDIAPDETKILLLQTLDAGNRVPLSLVVNWTQKLRAAN